MLFALKSRQVITKQPCFLVLTPRCRSSTTRPLGNPARAAVRLVEQTEPGSPSARGAVYMTLALAGYQGSPGTTLALAVLALVVAVPAYVAV